jgi:predicted RNA-binding protein with PUA-like domain
MAKQFWLVKQEPEDYPWEQLVQDGRTAWTGVRNFQARNFLRAMKVGDLVLFYHSVSDKQVVGIAKVVREAYPDPTVEPDEAKGDWVCVDIAPELPLKKAVSLSTIKEEAILKDMLLVRQSRLSVMPITAAQFNRITRLAETTI